MSKNEGYEKCVLKFMWELSENVTNVWKEIGAGQIDKASTICI